MHFFGSERGLLATPTQCGTYPVESEFVPWNTALDLRAHDQPHHHRLGPERHAAARAAPGPFAPELEAGVADTTAGVHSPFSAGRQARRRRPEPDRPQRHDPAGLRGDPEGHPVLPGGGDRDGSATPAYPGLAEQADAGLPGREPGRHRRRRRRRRDPAALLPGKVYLAGPYKGAPLSLVVVAPRRLRPLRPRQRRGPGRGLASTRSPPRSPTVSDPLPQILEGIPLRTRSIQIDLDRPNFALNPTNCDPFAVDATITGDEGGVGAAGVPLPGRQLRRPALRAEAQPEAQRRRQAARPPGAQGGPSRPGRAKPTLARSRSRCRRASCSTTPTSDTICTRVAVRRGRLPGGLGLGTREGDHPAARRAAERQRLPALLQQQAARPGRRPRGPDRHRALGHGSTASKAPACGPPSKPSPTRRSPSSSSTWPAARRAC